jgi:hypothetical protein
LERVYEFPGTLCFDEGRSVGYRSDSGDTMPNAVCDSGDTILNSWRCGFSIHPQLAGERAIDVINAGRSGEVLGILDRLDSGACL